jgi:hypothetical protein
MKLIPFEAGEIVEGKNDIVVIKQSKLTKPESLIQTRKKSLAIEGKKFDVDPQTMMRMIKQVTRTIGEYKAMDNPMASYVTSGMRKSRDNIVADLQRYFGINWQLDEEGNSVFYM